MAKRTTTTEKVVTGTEIKEMVEVAEVESKKEEKKEEKKAQAVNCIGFRDALVEAHNNNNKKAIDESICKTAGVDVSYLTQWKAEVNKLYDALKDYMKIKLNPSAKVKTKAALEEARNKIYPAWKEIMSNGEPSRFKKELKCEEDDVESLIGYMEAFFPTAVGTQRTIETQKMFRKHVEALLGCKMAKNRVLKEEEIEVIRAYEGAVKSIPNLEEQIKNAKDRVKFLNVKISETKSEDFQAWLRDTVRTIENGKKDADGKVIERGIVQLEESLSAARNTIETLDDEYVKIKNSLKQLEFSKLEKTADVAA